MSSVYIPPGSNTNSSGQGQFITQQQLNQSLQRYALNTTVADKIGTAGGTIIGSLNVESTFTNANAITAGTPAEYLFVVADNSGSATNGQFGTIAGGGGGGGSVTTVSAADTTVITVPGGGITTTGTVKVNPALSLSTSLTTPLIVGATSNALTIKGDGNQSTMTLGQNGISGGVRGAVITSNYSGIDLVDLNLASNVSSTGATIRYEHRSSYVLPSNTAGEIQVGPAGGTAMLRVGAVNAAINSSNVYASAPTTAPKYLQIGSDGTLGATNASGGGAVGNVDASTFGVVYNNSGVDNTTNMQAAVNSCQTTGLDLYITGNVYLNNATPIIITASISIVGCGRWAGTFTQQNLTAGILQINTFAQYKLYNLAFTHINPATAGIQIEVLPQSANPSSFFNISNCYFGNSFCSVQLSDHFGGVISDCTFSAPTNTGTTAIKIVSNVLLNYGDSTVTNCFIENYNFAMYQQSNMGIRFRNCKIANCTYAYYLYYSTASGGDFFFSGNSLEGGGGLNFNCANLASPFGTVMITDNEIACTLNQSPIFFSESGGGGGYPIWVTGVTITGNQIGYGGSSTTNAMILLAGINGFTITGNTFSNGGATIPVYQITSTCTNGNIEKNLSQTGTYAADNITGTNITQSVVCNLATNVPTSVPFYDTKGYLSQSSNLQWNTGSNLLSATNLTASGAVNTNTITGSGGSIVTLTSSSSGGQFSLTDGTRSIQFFTNDGGLQAVGTSSTLFFVSGAHIQFAPAAGYANILFKDTTQAVGAEVGFNASQTTVYPLQFPYGAAGTTTILLGDNANLGLNTDGRNIYTRTPNGSNTPRYLTVDNTGIVASASVPKLNYYNPSFSGVALTQAATNNLGSLSLPAGTWSVDGSVLGITTTGNSFNTSFFAGINTSSTTDPAAPYYTTLPLASGSTSFSVTLPRQIFVFGSTTTIYLVLYPTMIVGSATGGGQIVAIQLA